MHIISLFFTVAILLGSASEAHSASIKEDVEKTALAYFLNEAHPVTGLVRDRAQNFTKTPATNRVASMAATGFGLAVIAHAAHKGTFDKKRAINYVKKTLLFSRERVSRYKGWFLHFVNWETGARIWNSEYSTIDTALFMAGALYAAKVLKDPYIDGLAEGLYREMDFWDMMTDAGTQPNKRTITLSYTPEHGYVPYQWEIYSEQMILIMLGLGHPVKPLPKEVWKTWQRGNLGIEMPLFIHQYSLLFLDMRTLNEGYGTYFQAGLDATLLHRNYLSQGGFWGLSAGDSQNGYRVYSPVENDATFCVGCAAGSLMFAPKEIYSDIEGWKNGENGKKVWGQYGLVDSLNVNTKWFSKEVLGITKGPEYLSSVNTDNQTSLWYDFMSIPAMQRAMQLIR